jgi:hypothetical protein
VNVAFGAFLALAFGLPSTLAITLTVRRRGLERRVAAWKGESRVPVAEIMTRVAGERVDRAVPVPPRWPAAVDEPRRDREVVRRPYVKLEYRQAGLDGSGVVPQQRDATAKCPGSAPVADRNAQTEGTAVPTAGPEARQVVNFSES